jgi:hypothetical protein
VARWRGGEEAKRRRGEEAKRRRGEEANANSVALCFSHQLAGFGGVVGR